jgi:hypothetical protein
LFTYTCDLNGQQVEIKDNNPNAVTDTFDVTSVGLGGTTKVQELKSGVERASTRSSRVHTTREHQAVVASRPGRHTARSRTPAAELALWVSG